MRRFNITFPGGTHVFNCKIVLFVFCFMFGAMQVSAAQMRLDASIMEYGAAIGNLSVTYELNSSDPMQIEFDSQTRQVWSELSFPDGANGNYGNVTRWEISGPITSRFLLATTFDALIDYGIETNASNAWPSPSMVAQLFVNTSEGRSFAKPADDYKFYLTSGFTGGRYGGGPSYSLSVYYGYDPSIEGYGDTLYLHLIDPHSVYAYLPLDNVTFQAVAPQVPEPSTLIMLITGLLVMICWSTRIGVLR